MSAHPCVTGVIEDFGASIGIQPLPLRSDGSVTLTFESQQTMTLQVLESAVLVLLTRPIQGDSLAAKMRALSRLGELAPGNVAYQVGLTRDSALAVIVRIPDRQFDLSAIERARAQAESLLDFALAGTAPRSFW
jgi:type III secretion system chaperone SycN